MYSTEPMRVPTCWYPHHRASAAGPQIGVWTLFLETPVRIKDIMTPDPRCCTPDTTAREAAGLMRDCDCGAIPVVDTREGRRPIGMVTDRDLAIRGFADGRGPDTPVRDLMSERPHAARADDEIEIVRQVM